MQAAHLYTDYVYVPGVAIYEEVPSTPTFSRVRFNAPATSNEELRQKYVRRMRITPIRIQFSMYSSYDIMHDVELAIVIFIMSL